MLQTKKESVGKKTVQLHWPLNKETILSALQCAF